MSLFKNKIFRSNNITFLLLLLIFNIGLFFAIEPVRAAEGNALMSAIVMVLGWIAYALSYVIGLLLSLMVGILVFVAQYNDIIDVEAVNRGWVIVRDLCNMFFILILLVIAFATILRLENYSAKRLLPKLLIMAVLINFSRTICGLIIDFAQVIMLTFVNGFAVNGAGNFVKLFQIEKYLSFRTYSEARAVGGLETAGAILAGLFAMVITLIVVAVLTMTLVMRIVILWVYVILSPLAFLTAAFPAGQKYSSQWWSEFSKQVIVGPVLAFFIWLALFTAEKSASKFTFEQAAGKNTETLCAGENDLFCSSNFQTYLITIALLIGGLMVTQQMGGAAASIAGKGMNWAKRAPVLMGKGAMWGGSWAGRKVKMGAISEMFAQKKVEDVYGKNEKGERIKIGKKTTWSEKEGREGTLRGKFGKKVASALYGLELRPTKIIKGFKEGLKSVGEEEEKQATVASSEALRRGGRGSLIKGLGVSRDLTEALAGPGGFLWRKGFKRIFNATKLNEEERMQQEYNKEQLEGWLKEKYTEEELNEKKQAVENNQEEITKEKTNIGVEIAKINGKLRNPNIKGDERKQLQNKKASLDGIVKKLDNDENRQQEILKQIEKELREKKNIVSKEDKEAKMMQLKTLKQNMLPYHPIQTFYADRERETLVREAMKKIGDNDNEEALIDMFNNAIQNNDKMAASAVMLVAAKVGHLNEIIQSQRATEDVKDEHGNIITKIGDYLRQGAEGLNALVGQTFVNKLGMGAQQAFAVQSEASSLAKSNGQYNLVESVGTRGGFLYQRKASEQQERARAELRKRDPERQLRDYTRLAWGDEIQDEFGRRRFRFSQLGLDNFLENAAIIEVEIERERFNKNVAVNIIQDKETLLNYIIKLEDKGKGQYYDAKKGEYKSLRELTEKMFKYGESIAMSQEEDVTGKGVKDIKKEVLEEQIIKDN